LEALPAEGRSGQVVFLFFAFHATLSDAAGRTSGRPYEGRRFARWPIGKCPLRRDIGRRDTKPKTLGNQALGGGEREMSRFGKRIGKCPVLRGISDAA
jgi:hypothetical protein